MIHTKLCNCPDYSREHDPVWTDCRGNNGWTEPCEHEWSTYTYGGALGQFRMCELCGDELEVQV